MAVHVALGNVAPVDYLTNEETGLKTKYSYPGLRHVPTEIALVPNDLFEQMRDVLNLWPQMSDAPPAWVSCPDSPMLETVLRDRFKKDQPEGWTGVMPEDFQPDIADDHDSVLGRIEVATDLDVPGESAEAAALTDTAEVTSADVAPLEDVVVVAPDAPQEG